jgi:hypothetical protein
VQGDVGSACVLFRVALSAPLCDCFAGPLGIARGQCNSPGPHGGINRLALIEFKHQRQPIAGDRCSVRKGLLLAQADRFDWQVRVPSILMTANGHSIRASD